MRRVCVLLLTGLVCLLVGAASSHAKGDVHAKLENPAELQRAAPGARITVAWTLSALSGCPRCRGQGEPRPFGASGVYLRVRGAAGGPPTIFTARSPKAGLYLAAVTVPARGIAAIAIGLEGWTTVRGRPTVRSDVFFAIANDPFVHRR